MDEQFYRGYEKRYLDKGIKLHPRNIKVPKGCWMCGNEKVDFTVEHIFPLWMLRHYSYEKEKINPTHLSTLGIILDTREQVFDQLVCGKICESCNNGWMSKLENEFKSLFTEGWRSNILTESKTYSQWLIKTATMLNVSQQRRVQIPADARHIIRDKNSNWDGWKVYVFKCKDDEPKLTWAQGAPILAVSHMKKQIDYEKIIGNVFICSLKIDDLGAVVYWHPEEVKHLEPALVFSRIYPTISDQDKLIDLPWMTTTTGTAGVDLLNNSHKWIKHLKSVRVSTQKAVKEVYLSK